MLTYMYVATKLQKHMSASFGGGLYELRCWLNGSVGDSTAKDAPSMRTTQLLCSAEP